MKGHNNFYSVNLVAFLRALPEALPLYKNEKSKMGQKKQRKPKVNVSQLTFETLQEFQHNIFYTII